MTLSGYSTVRPCGWMLIGCCLTASVRADQPPRPEPPPAREPVAVEMLAPRIQPAFAFPMAVPAEAPVAVWQAAPQMFARPANTKDEVKKALETTLAGRIGEIRRTCGLEPEQVADLETAAKGVVELAMQPTEDEPEAVQGEAVHGVVDTAQQPAEDEPEPDHVVGDGVITIHVHTAMATGTAQAKKAYEETWPKAVRRILNDQQQTRLDETRKRRRQRHQQAAITSCTAMIDRIVCLSDEQREPVSQVVADVVTQQFADRSIQQITGAAPQMISKEQFQNIFDEQQMSTWTAWRGGRLTSASGQSG